MSHVTLTAEERARMEQTHQPGATIVKRLGAGRTPVCMGCGMDWPCPGRRLLDATYAASLADHDIFADKAVLSSRALTSGIAYGLLSWAGAAIVVFLGYALGRRLGAW